MSVNIISKEGQVVANISNGSFLALIDLARTRDQTIPPWSGYHNSTQKWNSNHCASISKSLHEYLDLIDEVAHDGGFSIS